MHERKLDDVFLHGAAIQKNGRVMTDVLLVKVKSLSKSHFLHDDYTIVKRLAA